MAYTQDTTQHNQDLKWLLVRNSNKFLVKQKGLGKIFSREPGNLRQIHSYTYSGLVNDKAVGVEPSASGRGIIVSTKKTKHASNKVAGTHSTFELKKGGSRRDAGKVANTVAGYRSDLLKAAVARASAIRRSQRPRKSIYQSAPRSKTAKVNAIKAGTSGAAPVAAQEGEVEAIAA